MEHSTRTPDEKSGAKEQGDVFKAHAFFLLEERAKGCAKAFEAYVNEAASTLVGIDEDAVKNCHRVLELHHLLVHRLGLVAKSIASRGFGDG